MDNLQALHAFWSGFGLKAYDENSTPEKALDENGGKYMTHSAAAAFLGEPVYLTASLYHRSDSWEFLTTKVEEISRAIGYSGKVIPFDGGAIFIVRGNPFAQHMADENKDIRRIIINVAAEFLAAE